jgi:hypothetical protein
MGFAAKFGRVDLVGSDLVEHRGEKGIGPPGRTLEQNPFVWIGLLTDLTVRLLHIR